MRTTVTHNPTESVLTRVASDERGPRTAYDDIEVGANIGSAEWVVSRDRLAALCETDEDYHEWYSVNSPFQGVVAPSLMAYPPVRLLFSQKYNVRGLFYELHLENIRPIKPDTKLLVGAKIADKWIKRDREFVAYEGWVFDEAGNEIFRTRRAHVLDFIKRTSPRSRVALDSGNVVLSDNTELKTYVKSFEPPTGKRDQIVLPAESGLAIVSTKTPIGWRLPQVSRQMSLKQFADRHELLYGQTVWPEKNLHADAEAARLEGLSAPVASAPTIFAMVTRMMMSSFAEGWIVGGKLNVKIVKPVYPENFITAKGHVIAKTDENGYTRLSCEVWAENERQEKVVVGNASGLVHGHTS